MIEHIGNIELLKMHKTAFLCSRKVPAMAVLKCYDWAIAQREAGNCVISGFHSQLEKDVFHYLLKGKQPIILVLARGMKKNIEPELVKSLEEGRLLIVSPFEKSVNRMSKELAETRNRLMVEISDRIVIGYASTGGNLERLIHGLEDLQVEYLVSL